MVGIVDEWDAIEKVENRQGRVNKMNEKQLFSVLVRAVGIIVFLEGLRTFWLVFVQWALPPINIPGWGLALAVPTLSYGLFTVVLGSTMIRWPGWLVHLAWLERLPTIGRMPDDES
jgi:hypothetical protein